MPTDTGLSSTQMPISSSIVRNEGNGQTLSVHSSQKASLGDTGSHLKPRTRLCQSGRGQSTPGGLKQ